MSSAAELLASEARGKLDGQRDALESARTRAAVALTLSGVVVGFFVQATSKQGPVGTWELAALAAFILSAAAGIYVLFGHKMTLVPDGNEWLDWVRSAEVEHRGQIDAGKDVEDTSGPQFAVTMASTMFRWYKLNRCLLRRIQAALAVTWAAVMLQIVFWAVSTLKFSS